MQGTAHRIDDYLRTMLRRHRERAAERTEKYHLEQMLFRKNVSGALLSWADKRYSLTPLCPYALHVYVVSPASLTIECPSLGRQG